ncbi:ARMT1-like domain-containing protein [Wukongibacter baidiensis]|uniref:damage-control phosphatase ARMT1 family protein n=1 Tax=Wukongibacter baidiensis TaxID=1723361 RepID=UPI003D7F3715
MKIVYECIPCLVRQSAEAAKMVTDDVALQQKIITKSMEDLSKMSFSETAPYLGRLIHKHVKEVSNNPDPYKELKIEFNQLADQISKDLALTDLIKSSNSPIDTACRLAIAGNIIDFSASRFIDEKKIRETIDHCLEAEIKDSMTKVLSESVSKSKKILFLADNSGEIVFDKLLIEELPKEKITYVVKGEPIVNDATMDDAVKVGMVELVRVIDNGSDAQGTILELCSDRFKEEFENADLIISKGQANYETLSEVKDKEIFFLLKAKCKSIADNLGCSQGDLVLKRIS